jgi:hypothetical protein
MGSLANILRLVHCLILAVYKEYPSRPLLFTFIYPFLLFAFLVVRPITSVQFALDTFETKATLLSTLLFQTRCRHSSQPKW